MVASIGPMSTAGCGGGEVAPRGFPLAEAGERARILPGPNFGPDFELLALDGHPYRLSDFRGSVVVLNFWATWCTSCRAEIPELNRLRREMESRAVTIVGVATDSEGAEKVVPYAAELGIEYLVLLDSERSEPRSRRRARGLSIDVCTRS